MSWSASILQWQRSVLIGAVWLGSLLAHADEGAVAPSFAAPMATADTPYIRANDIDQALTAIYKDPNINAEETRRILRWRSDPKPAKRESSSWSQFWKNVFGGVYAFFEWIAESSRLLAWLVLGSAAACLVVLILRWLRRFEGRVRIPEHAPPTHVQNLDIRPDSLPNDVGAEVWKLWQSAQQRAALALLYRGILSRLVNVHATPIKASSTEAECLSLCQPTVSPTIYAYVSRATQSWQQAVYAGMSLEDATVQGLCSEFAAAMDHRSVSP